MSTFKHMVTAGLQHFLDPDIFGEPHFIEGKEVIVVVDDDMLREKQGGAAFAIAESSLLFYAKVADLPPRKAPGGLLTFDGRVYIVDDWSEAAGMATVTLNQNRSSG